MLTGIIVLVSIIIICVLWLIPGYTSPIKDKQGNILQGSIASLEKVNLGGQVQWILIRGADTSKPVILFLHGGPGTADMGLLRKYMLELEKHSVVVTWDQRGAGKSFAAVKPEYSMTIEQFLSDTYELTKILCNRFKKEKIFLAGHSWGSVLGILSVKNHPELYEAYIGIGQVANMQEGERLSYEWTIEQAKKANDKKAVKKLMKIGEPPYSGKWQKKLIMERRYVGKYGGEVYGSSRGAFPLVIGRLIRSTEYSLSDKVNFLKGIFKSIRLIWPDLQTVNLMEQAASLKIPIYFVLGKHDYEVPYNVAEKYFEILDAPRKELIWFDNSAHFPNVEENKKFIDLLINRVLAATNIKKLGL